jgi:LTXXQ motif family protein
LIRINADLTWQGDKSGCSTRERHMKSLAGAALVLALISPASAEPHADQEASANEAGSGMGMMHGMCPTMGQQQRAEGWLAFLKTELKISSGQTSQWDAFADAYRAAKGHAGPMPMMKGRNKTVQPFPERMEHHARMMEDHLSQMKKIQGPVKQLYDALNNGQKRTADELLPMVMMCRMM